MIFGLGFHWISSRYLSIAQPTCKAVGQFLTQPSEHTPTDYTHVFKLDEDVYEKCTADQIKSCLRIDEMP